MLDLSTMSKLELKAVRDAQIRLATVFRGRGDDKCADAFMAVAAAADEEMVNRQAKWREAEGLLMDDEIDDDWTPEIDLSDCK